jgi:ribosome-interacting GTPase 1
MPANLHPEAQKKWMEYQQAKTLDERIEKLEEFLSSVNKHKGNEKLIAINKTRLAQLKEEREIVEQRRKSLSSRRDDAFTVKREHQNPQILLISDFFEQQTGAGKSTLLKNLTGVADVVPGVFTPEPVVGIFSWKKVKFQLAEIPALHEAQYLNKVLTIIRTTDIVAIVVDLTRDPILQIEHVLKILQENNIFLNHRSPPIKLERTGAGGVQIFFLSRNAEKSEHLTDFIKDMVKEWGSANAVVKIFDEITIQDLETAFNKGSVFLKGIIIASKADASGSKQNFQILKEKYDIDIKSKEKGKSYFEIFPVAVKMDENGKENRIGLENIGERIIKLLGYIQLYTKSKKGIADRPLLMPEGSTVGEVALKIHKDMFNTFKFAFIYREKGPQKKIRAGLQYPIEENDVIEIFSDL